MRDPRMRRIAVRALVLVGAAASLSGCGPDQRSSSVQQSAPAMEPDRSVPTAAAAESTGPVEHATPNDEGTVVATADDETGSATFGPFPVDAQTIVVEVTCRGAGTIVVTVDPAGSFTYSCGSQEQTFPTRVDVSGYDASTYRVAVAGADGPRWAMTVSTED